jgi:hypothetical protein
MSLLGVFVDTAQWRANVDKAVRLGFPEAIADTLNTTATTAAVRALMNVKRDFTLRNQYTEGSLHIGKMGTRYNDMIWPADPARKIQSMNAVIGSKSPYLPLHDTGGTERAASGKALAMPTVAGRGGDVKKAIPTYFRLRAMGAIGGGKQGYTASGRRRKGKGFFILGPGPTLREPAIFFREVGTPGAPLMKIRLLGKKAQPVKATHWHTSAVRSVGTFAQMNATFERAMVSARAMRELAPSRE